MMCFNRAFLAKQCWCLWHNSNSLAISIIKIKYYPHNTILEARLGRRPSFAWRSLLSACDLLKHGLIWRAGDGKDIKVLGDKWLPTPISYSIQAHWSNGGTPVYLKKYFKRMKARVICHIPLSPNQQKYSMIWRGISRREFSVRSAYHLEKKIHESMRCGGGSRQKKEDGSMEGDLEFKIFECCENVYVESI